LKGDNFKWIDEVEKCLGLMKQKVTNVHIIYLQDF
jgi:hypothetical protein